MTVGSAISRPSWATSCLPSSSRSSTRTQTLCAVMPADTLVNGAYYADAAVSEEAQAARNMDDGKALYDYCDEVTRAFQS